MDGSSDGVAWPGDIIVEPDLTMVNGDIDKPFAVEHQFHDRLNFEDDLVVHEHVSSRRLLHEHLRMQSPHLLHPSMTNAQFKMKTENISMPFC